MILDYTFFIKNLLILIFSTKNNMIQPIVERKHKTKECVCDII